MSRYSISLVNNGRVDDNASIGYDAPLRTFFLQGFFAEDSDFDEPEIWLGTGIEEFHTLESIIAAARVAGYEVRGMTRKMVVAMIKESSTPTPPSLGERLGIVK